MQTNPKKTIHRKAVVVVVVARNMEAEIEDAGAEGEVVEVVGTRVAVANLPIARQEEAVGAVWELINPPG